MSKSALVVDDSKSARFALRKFLEGLNYRVEVAESAAEGMRLLQNWLPDVILLDHIMPGVDGFEMLRQLKTNSRTAVLPVVVCSSNGGEAYVQAALARGASKVIQKPPSPEILDAALRNLANRIPDYSKPLPPLPEDWNLSNLVGASLPGRSAADAMGQLMATIPASLIPTAHLPEKAPMVSPFVPGAPTAAAAPVLGQIVTTLPPVPSGPRVVPVSQVKLPLDATQLLPEHTRGAPPAEQGDDVTRMAPRGPDMRSSLLLPSLPTAQPLPPASRPISPANTLPPSIEPVTSPPPTRSGDNPAFAQTLINPASQAHQHRSTPPTAPTVHLPPPVATLPPVATVSAAAPSNAATLQQQWQDALRRAAQSLQSGASTSQEVTKAPKGLDASVPPPTLVQIPSLLGDERSSGRGMHGLDELDTRISKMSQDLYGDVGSLRAQLQALQLQILSEDRIRSISSDAARSRTAALAASLEQHLASLRSNLENILRAQNDRLNQVATSIRQIAAEEARRVVARSAAEMSQKAVETFAQSMTQMPEKRG